MNSASKTFSTDQEQNRTILGADQGDQQATALGSSNGLLVSMFEDLLAQSKVQHPIEKLRGITRPLQDVIEQWAREADELNEFRKTQSNPRIPSFPTR